MATHAFDVKDPKHATVYDSGVMVAEMAGRLWDFACGPHTPQAVKNGCAPGFWAVFHDTQAMRNYDLCDECEEPKLDWANVSHGETLPEAICLAARKAYDNDRENIEDGAR